MCPLVLRERRIVAERVVTIMTLEGPFSSMDPGVSRQTGPLDELLVTLLALVTAACLGLVTPLMSAEPCLTCEALATFMASID